MPTIQNPDRYAVTVKAAEFGETKTGTPYLSLEFSTEAGETITGWLYLSEKALANSVKTLRDAFGFDGDFETVIEQVVSKPCSITVELEEYEGKERLRVKWINGPRSSKPIDNQAEFLKALSAKAARIPKEASRAGTAPAKAPAKAAPAPAKAAPKAAAKSDDETAPF
jgi:hypothetical protein